jgi:hypothetical protein
MMRVARVVAIIAIIAGGWLTFDYGRQRAGYDSQAAEARQKMLQAELEELRGQNEELRGQNAILVQAADVDRKAYAEVDESLKDLQDEVLELKQEVDFYRGIVSPKGGEGLRVQEFSMVRNGESQSYRYKLVLSQFVKRRSYVKGYVQLTFHGMRGSLQKVLKLGDVSEDGNSLVFRFKYFQELAGDIVLPEDFEPLRVELLAVPQSRGVKTIKRMFSWPELLG